VPGETPSIGIGQGYNSFTILQLAHATATLAAGGTVMRPHVVKSINDPRDGSKALTIPVERSRIALKPEYLALVKQGMIEVNRVGTQPRLIERAACVRQAGEGCHTGGWWQAKGAEQGGFERGGLGDQHTAAVEQGIDDRGGRGVGEPCRRQYVR
jgi:hypothetical protein